MKNGIMVEPNDIKKILAEKYNVSENNIIKAQYSYMVMFDDEKEEMKDDSE